MIRRWRCVPVEATACGHVIPVAEATRLSGTGR